jgi:hypothetical protein
MSTPSHGERDDGSDEPSRYPPRWTRRSPQVKPEWPGRVAARPPNLADAPPVAPGSDRIVEPPPSFAGDVAIKELRQQLSLDRDLVLRPPVEAEREPLLPWIARFSLVPILAAIIGFGATLLLFPNTAPKQQGIVADAVSPARLVIEGHTAFANEPIPLGVALNGGSGGEMLTLIGLATGTKLTAGGPLGRTGWQLSARDVGKAYAYAPKDFVGVMDAAVDLRSPRDRVMDSQIVRLEWIPRKEAIWVRGSEPTKPGSPALEPIEPSPAAQQLDPQEIAILIKRGEEFLKYGDVAAARLSLRRAASAGSAEAALALGVTFDPAFLRERGILGFAPDVVQARTWYERAAALGSRDAAGRLERLTRQ